MKQLTVVGLLLVAVANEANAQITDIHTRWGESGAHFTLPAGTQSFGYEATVHGCTSPFMVQLQVFHNSTLKFTDTQPVPIPVSPYVYECSVSMSDWGLKSGDTVTFVLRVIDMASGATLGTHVLHGDVAGT